MIDMATKTRIRQRNTFWMKTPKGAVSFEKLRSQIYTKNNIREYEKDIDMRIVTQFKGKRNTWHGHPDNRREGTGIVYLTSGGRIVQDVGWGEYFDSSDKPICTINELRHGLKPEDFIKRIHDLVGKE